MYRVKGMGGKEEERMVTERVKKEREKRKWNRNMEERGKGRLEPNLAP